MRHGEQRQPKAVYNELNLNIVYHNDGHVQVSAGPNACT